MKKNAPLICAVIFVLCWAGILCQLYEKGRYSKALIYAEIHPETIRFLDSLSNRLDLFIQYDPGIRPDDWKNKHNFGEDTLTGLGKIEDDFFIIYFEKDGGEAAKAEKLLRWANEGIPELAGLLGRYPYPADVNGRKLPIYLADTKGRYGELATMLKGAPYERIHNTVGVYFSRYSQMGNLTTGILLSPAIWQSDAFGKEVLWHEMNHYAYFTLIEYDKAVRPYMWVYEGLADYFAHESMPQLREDQIRRCRSFTLSATFPDYNANYWAGESVYWFMEERYAKEAMRAFIQNTYSGTVEQSFPAAFGKPMSTLENEWKVWLEK